MTTKVEAQLVAHSKTGLWLRVYDGEAHKVLTYSHEGIRLAQSVTKGTMLTVEVTDPEVVWVSSVSQLGQHREYDVWGWRFAGEILKVEVN